MDPEALAWTTFILALIGAGAWVPAIREWLQKPEVHIVSGETLEVSYLEFGGVLNLSCAFAVFNKAALIESLALDVEHEGGTRHEFFCVSLAESATAQSSSGERTSWNKFSGVHTLALSKDSSVERQVMFRDRAVSSQLKALVDRVIPVWERLKANDGTNWRDAMRRTPEYDEYRRALQDGQPWRRGCYTAVMTVKVRKLDPLKHRFTFELTEADMRAIRSNLPLLDTYISGQLVQAEPPVPRPAMAFAFPMRRIREEIAALPVAQGR